ncbi:hypothetical protein PG988_007842 [Apiospora saccharicola]
MCAISDIEISNDNEGGSISGSNRSSNEDESENQGKDENNNNNNFVVKFRADRISVGDARAGFVFLLLSAGGLAAHAAFKQQQRRQQEQEIQELLKQHASSGSLRREREQCHDRIWEDEYNYSKTGSEESSGTSSQGNDGGTNVLAEFRFLDGGSNLGGGPPDSITKKPRAHLAVAVPSTGNTNTGESTFLLTPTTAASVSALLDDEDDNETTTNNKADNDNKTDNGDSDGAANRNPITPDKQDENPSTEDTTEAPEQGSIGDQQSESAEDTPTIAKKKDPEPKPPGNTIFRLGTATTTTTLQSSQQIDGPEALATLGLQRILSLDLTGGSETALVVGRILLSLLSGAVDEKAESEEKEKEEEECPEVFCRVHIHRRPRNNKPQQLGETAQDGSETSAVGHATSSSRNASMRSESVVKPKLKSRKRKEPKVKRQGGEEQEATADSDENREGGRA